VSVIKMADDLRTVIHVDVQRDFCLRKNCSDDGADAARSPPRATWDEPTKIPRPRFAKSARPGYGRVGCRLIGTLGSRASAIRDVGIPPPCVPGHAAVDRGVIPSGTCAKGVSDEGTRCADSAREWTPSSRTARVGFVGQCARVP